MGKKNFDKEFRRLHKQATVVTRATACNMAAAARLHRQEVREVRTSPAAENYFRLISATLA